MSNATAHAQGFVISPGPHLRTDETTARIMWTVNATLAPAAVWGVFVFGYRAGLVIGMAVAGCVAAEWLAAKMMKAKLSVADGSAVCTGLLLALTLPPLVAPWMALLGGAFAILLGKMIFGGLGYNLFNPALLGRAFMMATFPLPMTSGWATPRPWFANVDAVTTATPLGALREHGMEAAMKLADAGGSFWGGLLFGMRPGSIGEVSILLVVLGGAVLLTKGIIKPIIPVSVVVGLALAVAPTGQLRFHLMTGGLWLGAFFMATDYVTSPNTRNGQIVFGLVIGALTGVIRTFGGYPEGICYAILIANTLVPALNLWFPPARPAMVGVPS